jgi:hypothetical protein
VTKSALVTRDIDILARMAKRNLAKVALSVTTLDPKLSRVMEPRAATPDASSSAIRCPTAVPSTLTHCVTHFDVFAETLLGRRGQSLFQSAEDNILVDVLFPSQGINQKQDLSAHTRSPLEIWHQPGLFNLGQIQ